MKNRSSVDLAHTLVVLCLKVALTKHPFIPSSISLLISSRNRAVVVQRNTFEMQLTNAALLLFGFSHTALALAELLKVQEILAGSQHLQCAEVRKFEGIISLVNDTEKLAEFEDRHNLTQSEIDDIKAEALADAERLKALQANTTLMQQCAELEAGRELRADCREMRRLTEVSNLADNQTALEEFQRKHDLPTEWITKLTEKAANATERLKQLHENSTLVAECDLDTQSQLQACELRAVLR